MSRGRKFGASQDEGRNSRTKKFLERVSMNRVDATGNCQNVFNFPPYRERSRANVELVFYSRLVTSLLHRVFQNKWVKLYSLIY